MKTKKILRTAIESKFANTVSSSYEYAIVKGKRLNRKEIVADILDFIKYHYATSESESCLPMMRVSYTDFTAKFGAWNSEKWEVTDTSLDLHSYIVDALFKIAKKQLKEGKGRIPCLKTNKNGIAMMVTVPAIYYSQYYHDSEIEEGKKASKKASKKVTESEETTEDSNILTIDANSPSQASALVIQLIAKYADNPEFDLSAIQHSIDSALALNAQLNKENAELSA